MILVGVRRVSGGGPPALYSAGVGIAVVVRPRRRLTGEALGRQALLPGLPAAAVHVHAMNEDDTCSGAGHRRTIPGLRRAADVSRRGELLLRDVYPAVVASERIAAVEHAVAATLSIC